jgi:hypothetical protein
VQEDINDLSKDRVQAILEGLLTSSYMSFVLDQDDRAEGLRALATKAWQKYTSGLPAERTSALGINFKALDLSIRDRLLNPTNGMPPEAAAILRTKLNLPAEKTPPTAPQEQSAAPQDKKAP